MDRQGVLISRDQAARLAAGCWDQLLAVRRDQEVLLFRRFRRDQEAH